MKINLCWHLLVNERNVASKNEINGYKLHPFFFCIKMPKAYDKTFFSLESTYISIPSGQIPHIDLIWKKCTLAITPHSGYNLCGLGTGGSGGGLPRRGRAGSRW